MPFAPISNRTALQSLTRPSAALDRRAVHTISPMSIGSVESTSGKTSCAQIDAIDAARTSRQPVASRPTRPTSRLIRGKALIFWDPKLPGTRYRQKLDAIDTDQITPAADCVSESLDTLDERWKAGSFRYLMPDFRERVHRGETFLIAGDRFAIGSSREMSPAGLKGDRRRSRPRDGDRLRRQHGRHLPPQRAQPRAARRAEPEAVADAQDGDEFDVRPGTRQLTNVTQGKTYDSAAADAEGRRDPPERRHLHGRTPRVPQRPSTRVPASSFRTQSLARGDDDDRADRLGASRRQGSPRTCAPGDTLRSTRICCRRRTARRRSRFTRSTRSPAATRFTRGRRRSPTITSCSPAMTTTSGRRRSAARSRKSRGSSRRTTRRPATASFTSIFPSRGWCCRVSSFPAPIRTAAPTALTAQSASASDRRRSGSDGRPATSTSRWRRRDA